MLVRLSDKKYTIIFSLIDCPHLSSPSTLALPSPTKFSLQMVATGLTIGALIRLAVGATLGGGTKPHLVHLSLCHPLCFPPYRPCAPARKITDLPNSVCVLPWASCLTAAAAMSASSTNPPPLPALPPLRGSIISWSSFGQSSTTMRHHIWMGDKVGDGDSSLVNCDGSILIFSSFLVATRSFSWAAPMIHLLWHPFVNLTKETKC